MIKLHYEILGIHKPLPADPVPPVSVHVANTIVLYCYLSFEQKTVTAVSKQKRPLSLG